MSNPELGWIEVLFALLDKESVWDYIIPVYGCQGLFLKERKYLKEKRDSQ
jgi:hypothetical protein